ncbi:MAG: hypothetical protein HQK49_05530 [Oligoflexia bacterium]|nr:hypothetical protein [Oligoflexia bacterium]
MKHTISYAFVLILSLSTVVCTVVPAYSGNVLAISAGDEDENIPRRALQTQPQTQPQVIGMPRVQITGHAIKGDVKINFEVPTTDEESCIKTKELKGMLIKMVTSPKISLGDHFGIRVFKDRSDPIDGVRVLIDGRFTNSDEENYKKGLDFLSKIDFPIHVDVFLEEITDAMKHDNLSSATRKLDKLSDIVSELNKKKKVDSFAVWIRTNNNTLLPHEFTGDVHISSSMKGGWLQMTAESLKKQLNELSLKERSTLLIFSLDPKEWNDLKKNRNIRKDEKNYSYWTQKSKKRVQSLPQDYKEIFTKNEFTNDPNVEEILGNKL